MYFIINILIPYCSCMIFLLISVNLRLTFLIWRKRESNNLRFGGKVNWGKGTLLVETGNSLFSWYLVGILA